MRLLEPLLALALVAVLVPIPSATVDGIRLGMSRSEVEEQLGPATGPGLPTRDPGVDVQYGQT